MDVGRHPKIRLLAYSEVEGVEGELGHFRVRVRRKARYVDEKKCTGCGECAKVCPIELPANFDMGLGKRKAIYQNYPQGIPPAYTVEKLDKSPCANACPGQVNAHGYVSLIAQGRYEDAMKVVMRNLPLPGVLGRVCPHPCETSCRRGEVDEPVSVCVLKRFVADTVDIEKLVVPEIEKKNERVAIIGAGPAGLTAAYFLALDGYGVTIHESLPVAGGMLRVGIPDYRLPPAVLEKEIRAITGLGVEIRYNSTLGRDFTIDELFAQGHKAVYLAIGAHRSLKLNIEGEDTDGVMHGVDFLRAVNLYEMTDLKGKRVVVVGGGDVAIDAARCAARTGAETVSILYRRTRSEMPAREDEIEGALAEGIEIKYLVSPRRVFAEEGKVVGIECIGMELGEADASGRRRPIPVPGSEFTEDCDIIIAAIGQTPDSLFLAESEKLRITRFGTIKVDEITYQTDRAGVFAGGDAQSGPWIAIGAVAAGREAAISISRYLKGEDMAAGRKKIEFPQKNFSPVPLDIEKKARVRQASIPMAQRRSGFSEVELGITEEQAVAEASRCLDCMICCECKMCEQACLACAIDHKMEDQLVDLDVGAIILATGYELFDARRVPEYGYGRLPNVVTALEFERLLSAAGPTQGHVYRPSDLGRAIEEKETAHRLAFIQCVGSRDSRFHKQCSAFCCMHAIKEAVIAREHDPKAEAYIFGMDIRAVGKNFEEYRNRAENEAGVKFIRSRVAEVGETGNHNPVIWYEDTKTREVRSIEVDLAILATACEPGPAAMKFSKLLGVPLNEFGFYATKTVPPPDTLRPGVFTCGCAQGPMDIPESVAQASSAAARAARALSVPEPVWFAS